MTFGSHRLRRPEQQTNYIALYNDVGPDWLEIFPQTGRTIGTATVIPTTGIAATNVQFDPTFTTNGDYLATGHSGGSDGDDIKIYQSGGGNTWNEVDTPLTSGVDHCDFPTTMSFNRSLTLWNGANLLAVASSLGSEKITLIYVPGETGYKWTDAASWDTFTNDEWGYFDQWDGMDTWAAWPDDRWDPKISVFQELGDGSTQISVHEITFSNNDYWLAATGTQGGSPYLQLWKPAYSGSYYTGYTEVTHPTTNRPTGTGRSICFSSTTKFMVVGSTSYPYLWIYEYDSSSQEYIKITNPSFLPDGTVTSVRFDPTDSYLAVGLENGSSNNDDTVIMYKVSGSTFTKITDISPMPTDRVLDIQWTKDGNYVVICQDGTNSYLFRKSGGDTFTRVHTFGDAVSCAVYPPANNAR